MAPNAPPIDGQAWINSEPLTSAHLRGRVVVLVFWASSCEASLLQVQQVQRLVATIIGERTTPESDPDIVPVAVHCPRMPMDDEVERLRHTVTRHRITMPVVHDPRFQTWNRYEPPGWPSTAIIDGNNKVSGIVAGCHGIDIIETAIRTALAMPPSRRRRAEDGRQPFDLAAPLGFDSTPLPIDPAIDNQTPCYPEGVSVANTDQGQPLVAVADTGRDRVLLGRLDDLEPQVAVETAFTGLGQPTNLAFTDDGRRLVVVERETNTVSAIDITSGDRTLVTADLVRPTGISTDRDGSIVLCDGAGDKLYRAMANSRHSGYLVYPIAGSGDPGVVSGDARSSTLAQPSSVARSNAGLVFSDAASSNIRLLTDDGRVINITQNGLFDWGLVDGQVHRARLQRPGGMCVLDDGSIVIVDAGNNRLRRLQQRRIATLGLTGLSSPSAIATVDGQRVLVADTDNHRIVMVDAGSQTARRVEFDVSVTDDQLARDAYVSSASTVAAV